MTSIKRDAAAIGAAAGVIGLSFGAIAVAQGLPGWVPILMSLIVFAGGSQFLAVGLISAGNPFAAVLGGLLINSRHLPFGLAIGSAISDRLSGRLIGSHLLVDETTAFTLAQSDVERQRKSFWTVGVTLFITWNIGTVIGVLIGDRVSDPEVFGLDAAFPAGLLALLMPSLRDKNIRLAAIGGAVIAVATTPFLPAGLPVMVALVAILPLLRSAGKGPDMTAPVPGRAAA